MCVLQRADAEDYMCIQNVAVPLLEAVCMITGIVPSLCSLCLAVVHHRCVRLAHLEAVLLPSWRIG